MPKFGMKFFNTGRSLNGGVDLYSDHAGKVYGRRSLPGVSEENLAKHKPVWEEQYGVPLIYGGEGDKDIGLFYEFTAQQLLDRFLYELNQIRQAKEAK